MAELFWRTRLKRRARKIILSLPDLPADIDDNVFIALGTQAAEADKTSNASDEFLFPEEGYEQMPYKDGVGGRDNRLNDVLGDIPFNVREAMSPGQTQKDLSALTGGISDKVFKTIMPYRERATAQPAAFNKPDGVGGPKAGGQKPMTPAPDEPSSIPDMGRQGRAQSKALRDPDSYLGSAFDATLRKGIDTGRNYLRNQMNKDGLDSEDQSKIMARFDSKIADDKLLKAKGNEKGLVGAINRNDATREGMTAGRGERTLDAYRTANYGKGAKAAEIQRKFVKQ